MIEGKPLTPSRFKTLQAALDHAAHAEGGGLTFVELDETETAYGFAEVQARAARVAGALVARGVRRQDRVAIVLPTGIGFMDAFFGTLLAGAVPVPLYPPVRLGRLDEYHAATAGMLRAVDARMVLTDGRVRKLLGQAAARAGLLLGCVPVEELLAQNEPPSMDPGLPEDLGLIQFSSGSTVSPKPVALSHANILAQCAMLKSLLRVEREGGSPVGVSWLPLYHDMGLIGCLLSAMCYPGKLVLIPPEHFLAKPSLWLRALARHRATISAAPNFAFALCVKRVRDEELEGCSLATWQQALNGAEPVSAEGMRKFAARFAKFGLAPEALLPVYGLAEASLAVTFCPPRAELRAARVDAGVLAQEGRVEPGEREVASVGVPVPGMRVDIRDAADRSLPDGTVGRVVISGASVMVGYFRNPEATARAITGGFLDTGDQGFLSGGELYLTGRAKDLVIIRGANHAPQEFEDCLEAVEGVRAGCAVALGFTPPGGDGEALLVLAEKNPSTGERTEAEIRSAILERTGIKPHTVVLLAPGTLPRTSSGKLRRQESLRRYLAQALTAPRRVNLLTIAAEVVKSTVAFAMDETADGR